MSKAYYICDQHQGCRWRDTCQSLCRYTADATHAANKNKPERFFVCDPRSGSFQEVDSLQDMKDHARVILQEIKAEEDPGGD